MTEAESPNFEIPADELHNHFSLIFGLGPPVNITKPYDVPNQQPINDDDRNPSADAFTAAEVRRRLRRCSNTAQGPDGIRYAVWKEFDVGNHILGVAFNAVQRLQYVPKS